MPSAANRADRVMGGPSCQLLEAGVVKRWKAGYVNYFRADQTLIELTQFNTLDKQKLFTRGWLRVREHEQAVTFRSYTLIPLHRRTVTFSYDDAHATLDVDDAYLGNRWVYWNEEVFEKKRDRFRQQRRFAL